MSKINAEVNAAAVDDRSTCGFELDPAAPWGAVDSRAIDWPSYGIADFDMLDDDRKLLLCMAAYYTDFDFDPLFKRGDRRGRIGISRRQMGYRDEV